VLWWRVGYQSEKREWLTSVRDGTGQRGGIGIVYEISLKSEQTKLAFGTWGEPATPDTNKAPEFHRRHVRGDEGAVMLWWRGGETGMHCASGHRNAHLGTGGVERDGLEMWSKAQLARLLKRLVAVFVGRWNARMIERVGERRKARKGMGGGDVRECPSGRSWKGCIVRYPSR
jgi:hypothetical protein